MVKIMGAVLVGGACGYLGLKKSITLKRRAKNLQDISVSLEMLESEISFSVNKLEKAFKRVDRNGLFTTAAESIDEIGVRKAWDKAVNINKARLCLADADTDILMMLGKSIGKTDTDDQIKNIRYIKTLINEQSRQAGEEYTRLGKMYRSGGVLVGLMIIIILI